MYEEPLKYSVIMLGALTSGAASVINESTLIPLGVTLSVFVGCTWFLTRAAWKVSSSVQKVLNRLESFESRLTNVERDVQTIRKKI